MNGSWLGKNNTISEGHVFWSGDWLTYGKASSVTWNCSSSITWIGWEWKYERGGSSGETMRLPKRERIKKAGARNNDGNKSMIKENIFSKCIVYLNCD